MKLVWIGGKGDWVYLRKVACQNLEFNVPLRHTLSRQALKAGEFATFAVPRTLCLAIIEITCRSGAGWTRMQRGGIPRTVQGQARIKPASTLSFYHLVPGADSAARIKPDIVHTFHIGCGQDMCASVIVLLAKKGCFGNQRALDDKLSAAYARYQAYCHATQRYTACDEWTIKTLGVKTNLGLACFAFLVIVQGRKFPYELARQGTRYWCGLPLAST